MTDQKFFFIHIMRTAGRSLRKQIRGNFDHGEVYPDRDFDAQPVSWNGNRKKRWELLNANYDLEYLTALPPERRDRVRVFSGHFPFVAVELLGMDLTTITILRDPVERTLSHLRTLAKSQPDYRGRPLEEIYEDDFAFRCFIENHQTKIFAMSAEDDPKCYMDPLSLDERHLTLAKDNLERVDVLGMQDRFDELLGDLEGRFGWRFGQILHRNVTGEGDVPASFKRRIAEDNQLDIEFFEYGRRLYERRRTAGAVR